MLESLIKIYFHVNLEAKMTLFSSGVQKSHLNDKFRGRGTGQKKKTER